MTNKKTILSRFNKELPSFTEKIYTVKEGIFRSWIYFDGMKLFQTPSTVAEDWAAMLNGAYSYGKLKEYYNIKEFLEKVLK